MEYKVIDAEDVKNILKHRDDRISLIHRKMYTIQRDLRNTDDIIRSVSYPKSEMSGMPHAGGVKGLEDVYDKYRRVLDDRKKEYADMVFELVEEEITIERVWLCYLALPYPYNDILRKLYVEKQLYKVVEQESGMAHSDFERKRNTAIMYILGNYMSEKSATELYEAGQRIEQKESDDASGVGDTCQLSIWDVQ